MSGGGDCDYRDFDLSSFESTCYKEFECFTNSLSSKINYLLDNGFQTQKQLYNNKTDNQDDDLRNLIERKEEIRHQIVKKLKDISQQQTAYEKYKEEQKMLSQEIKDKHEAYLMAKKCYKKFLKMYYVIESKAVDKQTVFVQFFTEAKKDSDNYSVRFQRDSRRQYQILSTTPRLSCLKELKKILQETNDVPRVLCSIQQTFLKLKKK